MPCRGSGPQGVCSRRVPGLGGMSALRVPGPGGVCSGADACSGGGPGGDPPPWTATAAGGTHPTGMHSC